VLLIWTVPIPKLPRSQPSRKMLPSATAATMVALRGFSLPELISE
jgi:hypothetical protein